MEVIKRQQEHTPRRSRLWLLVLALFVGSVAFLGGSSRPDAYQIVALRPLAALLLIAPLCFVSRTDIAPVKPLLLGLLALAGLMILQLIPLPPAIWQSLPGRDEVAEMGTVISAGDLWRPISMVPSRTLNALASLIVPICGLLMLAVFAPSRRWLFGMLIGLGLVNAIFGVVQLSTGFGYLYEVTNPGSSVGLFANRNHTAVFASLVLLTIGYITTRSPNLNNDFKLQAGLIAAFLLVLTASLTSGSRAGLVTTIFALAAIVAMRAAGAGGSQSKKSSDDGFMAQLKSPKVLTAVFVLAALLLAAILVASGRFGAVERMLSAGAWDDLRWELIPHLLSMMGTHWVFGSGFGSFEEVFHIFEPSELLLPSYLNMAHNDWAQLVIEGGVLAVVILTVFLVWLLRAIWGVAFGQSADLAKAIYWCSLIAIICFASLVDYPLRTPLFQLVGIVFLVALCREREAANIAA